MTGHLSIDWPSLPALRCCVGVRRPGRIVAFGLALAGCGVLYGQSSQPPNQQRNQGKLAFVIPNLYGPDGLRLDNPDHDAHFDSSFQENFGPFNSAVASQLTSLPIPSPASGFTYTFDRTLGIYERTAQTFGPILTERAETLGKDRFYFGFTFQHFSFDDIDGISLNSFPTVFTHSDTVDPDSPFLQDVVTTDNLLDIQIGQFTSFFSYGLTDRVDLSVAIPLVSSTLDVVSAATVRPIGTANAPDDAVRLAHTFGQGRDVRSQTFSSGSSATGLGDIIVRLKGHTNRWERSGLAFAADIRLPTGDELNFLGTGAPGFKPFAIFSYNYDKISPHVNVGYQFNGESILGGDVRTGQTGDLPDQFLYSAGVDLGVSSKFSFAADFLGQRNIDAQRVSLGEAISAAGVPTSFNTLHFSRDSVNTADAAFGFKINPASTLLVTFNVIVKLNDGGLRSRVTPLVGLSFTP